MSETVLKKRKRSWLRLFVELLLILAVVFAVRYWFQRDLPTGQAPEFQAVLTDGKVVNLKDYRGEPMLLHFWASWCQFCKFSENAITDIQQDWQVLSVAFQSGEKQEVEAYVSERGLGDWDVIADQDGRLAELFAVQSVPASFIIDGEGNIRVKEVGLTTGWGLKARLWYAENIDGIKSSIGLDKLGAKLSGLTE